MTQIGLGFPSVSHLHLLAPAELIIDIVTLIFSALVNIWATGMITYQAWCVIQAQALTRSYAKI
jgi:hypothetical protein